MQFIVISRIFNYSLVTILRIVDFGVSFIILIFEPAVIGLSLDVAGILPPYLT